MRLFWHELRLQQLLFWRNRESAVFVFVFPPMLFLLLGAVYSGKIDGVPAVDRLLVGMMGYGCANTALGGARDHAGRPPRGRAPEAGPRHPTARGDLPDGRARLDARRLPPPDGATVALGVTLYGARGAESWVALVPVLLLGAAAFAGLGIGLAALIRSDEGASAVVNLVVLPMAFLSGSFGPTRDYPDVLQAVADVLPLTYLIRLVQAAYLHGTSLVHDLGAVAVVVAWGVAGLVVAVRRFEWQPREK